MANDQNQKPAINKQDTNQERQPISSQGHSSKSLPFSQRKKIVIGLLVLIIIVVGAWIIISKLGVGQKAYAEVDGHKISKNDVKELIGRSKGVSDRQAATVLADKYLTQALAKDQGVTVTDQDIQAQYGSDANLTDLQKDKYSYQTHVNSAYFAKLQQKYQGIYQGYVLVTQFSRYIPTQPVAPAYKAVIPQMGDAAAIDADKKYAHDLITDLYDQIKAGKITWEQAGEIERNDPRVGFSAYPALSHSGPFDTSKNPQPLFAAPSAQQKVSKMKAGQTVEPFVVSVFNPVSERNFDSYYLAVRMDKTTGGQLDGDFQQYLVQSKKRLGYKVNV